MDCRPEMRTQVYRLTVSELNRATRSGWKLPAYQRPLVWAPEQALALVQSVYEGYPIGAFLVWELSWDNALLLDGQQRLAALTGIRCGTDEPGPQVGWSFLGQKWCLVPEDPGDDWLSLRWWHEVDHKAKVKHLFALQDKYEGGDKPDKDGPWGQAIYAFDRVEYSVIPIHVLERATAAEAVEAFRRINTTGTPVDLNELAELLAAEAGGQAAGGA